MSGSYANRWPFNSSTGRTFGSPYSGYRGDYTVYPDEGWKQGLRKYPYLPPGSPSPARRHRSASPRRRAASAANGRAAAASQRQALIDILAKIDSRQEDLQALAAKVASWSRQAAGLAGGLQEEALLLQLSRQAAALAEAEAAAGELQKRERVVRLSRENGLLRNELRDMIRICKLLLDRDSNHVSGGGAASAAVEPIAPARPAARPATAAAKPTRSAATQVPPPQPLSAPPARNATQTTASLYYGSEDPYGALYGGGPDDDLAALAAAEAEAYYGGSRRTTNLTNDVSMDAIIGAGDAALEAADAAAQPTWTPPRSSLRHTAPLASPSPASPALATFTPAPATTTRVAGSTAATTYRGAGAAAAPGSTAGGGLYGEIRNMDLTMDAQLYDIRQQLLELRRDVALGRVATTAAAAPGGTPGYSPGSSAFAHTSTTAAAAAAPNTFFSPRVGAGAPATSAVAAAAAAAAPPPALSYSASAVEISRMKDEIADLRRQLSFDKAWYLHSLDGVVAGRSSMFADLQRRIDDLLAPFR